MNEEIVVTASDIFWAKFFTMYLPFFLLGAGTIYVLIFERDKK